MKWLRTETVNLKLLVPSGLTAALGVGAAVGYVVASKVLEKKFREIADAEIQEAKIYYQGLYSRPTFVADEVSEDIPNEEEAQAEFDALPAEAKERMIRNAVQAFDGYSPSSEDPEAAVKQPVTVNNIFMNHTPPGEEVLEALQATRDPAEPYIITKEEFYRNEPDHEQNRFTFYEGDSILVDDQDEYNPIQDTEKVAGDDNLLRFGYGSGDEHTLYVRNEALDPPIDLYITRSTGRYTDEVMGFNDDEPHLKHSQRRFRLDHE